ncbi:MAG: hypothetical protein WDZ30_08780 [Cellvibrionaceae bacterium]
MFFYIALACWLMTMVFSFSEGNRKLPSLSLGFGLVTLWLIYSRGMGAIGMSILAALAVIVYLGGKLSNVKSAR